MPASFGWTAAGSPALGFGPCRLPANIFSGTLASLVPIPGGRTAVASVGLSGALVPFGVPKEGAVAAVLTTSRGTI